jgi:hypothetical protein
MIIMSFMIIVSDCCDSDSGRMAAPVPASEAANARCARDDGVDLWAQTVAQTALPESNGYIARPSAAG